MPCPNKEKRINGAIELLEKCAKRQRNHTGHNKFWHYSYWNDEILTITITEFREFIKEYEARRTTP